MFLTNFDVFPKFTDENIHRKSAAGGVLTIFVSLWLSTLIFHKLSSALNPSLASTVIFDESPIQGQQKVFVSFSILFKSPCTVIHLDHIEDTGAHRFDIIENISRKRLDSDGLSIEAHMEAFHPTKNLTFSNDYCGPCYGALPREFCCNSCKQVMDAFESKKWSFFGADRWEQCVREGYTDFGSESCSMDGTIKIRKGNGEFRFGFGQNSSHSLNHTISKLEFGPITPGFTPPLNGATVSLRSTNFSVQYFLKIVPIVFHYSESESVKSFQYSVMYTQKDISKRQSRALQRISFRYEFTPMEVVSFVPKTEIMATIKEIGGLIGGAFSFAMILDVMMSSALKTIEGKRRIGKDL